MRPKVGDAIDFPVYMTSVTTRETGSPTERGRRQGRRGGGGVRLRLVSLTGSQVRKRISVGRMETRGSTSGQVPRTVKYC